MASGKCRGGKLFDLFRAVCGAGVFARVGVLAGFYGRGDNGGVSRVGECGDAGFAALRAYAPAGGGDAGVYVGALYGGDVATGWSGLESGPSGAKAHLPAGG